MKPKVLMVLEQEFPPDDRVYKEAQLLINEGYTVTLACTTISNRPLTDNFAGIKIVRKKLPGLIYKSSVAALKFPLYFYWWVWYLDSLFKYEQFDIVHIHDLPLAWVGAVLKRKYKVKLAVDLHENWPSYLTKATHTNTPLGKLLSSEMQWRNYEKDVLQKADLIITVVDEMKQRIANLGHAAEKICVLQNTIVPEEYPNLNRELDADKFVLFFAGGLNVERGLQYVIPALAKVLDKIPNITLRIVGKGSYLPNLQALVQENGLDEHVEFLGWKPLKEVLVMTSNAHVSIIPHIKWEQTDCSSPNKLFQCMLAGVPQLVSNIDSVARIINETKCGLVYEYNNEGDFIEKLLILHADPNLMTEMGERGRQAVLNNYNWGNTSKEFITMYNNL